MMVVSTAMTTGKSIRAAQAVRIIEGCCYIMQPLIERKIRKHTPGANGRPP